MGRRKVRDINVSFHCFGLNQLYFSCMYFFCRTFVILLCTNTVLTYLCSLQVCLPVAANVSTNQAMMSKDFSVKQDCIVEHIL